MHKANGIGWLEGAVESMYLTASGSVRCHVDNTLELLKSIKKDPA